MHEFQRITRLPPYVFAVVDELKLAARRKGEDIIDFGMGNPDLATPPHIIEKLVEAASNPRNHRYSASRGITKLRAAIASWYGRRYGVEVDPEREAIVTIGVKEGISHLALAITNPGDEPVTRLYGDGQKYEFLICDMAGREVWWQPGGGNTLMIEQRTIEPGGTVLWPLRQVAGHRI